MAIRFADWIKRLLVKQDKHAELLQYPLFKGLAPNELQLLHATLHVREYRAGDPVFEAGNPLEAIYLIAEGELVLQSMDGSEPRILKKHGVIGVRDFFGGSKRHASARAHSDLTLLALPRSDFREILSQNPQLGVKILEKCCQMLSRGDQEQD